MADVSSGFNPVDVNSVTYTGTLAVFLVAMKVPKIFVEHFPATGCLLVSNDAKFAKNLASYADILWARHAIFLPHVGEEDCVTSPRNVCVGGYKKSRSGISFRGTLVVAFSPANDRSPLGP